MNFLTICKRVVQEAGISGGGPTTVLNQTGQLRKAVDWTVQAWIDIQLSRPSWLFMNKQFTFNTVIGTRDYLAADYSITDVKLWDTGSFLIYETAIGTSDEGGLAFLPYGKWRDRYRAQMTARTNDRPQLFTVLTDNRVRFEPSPSKIFTISGDYKRSTQTFTADADVPTNLPEDFHMIIVWAALKYYAFYENAPEVLEGAERAYDGLLHRLEIEQLPEMDLDFRALA